MPHPVHDKIPSLNEQCEAVISELKNNGNEKQAKIFEEVIKQHERQIHLTNQKWFKRVGELEHFAATIKAFFEEELEEAERQVFVLDITDPQHSKFQARVQKLEATFKASCDRNFPEIVANLASSLAFMDSSMYSMLRSTGDKHLDEIKRDMRRTIEQFHSWPTPDYVPTDPDQNPVS